MIASSCARLRSPDNGDVDQTSSEIESVATYSCFDGFSLQGSQTRRCERDGRWSGSAPTCKS